MFYLIQNHHIWSLFTGNIPTFKKNLPLAIIYENYANYLINCTSYKNVRGRIRFYKKKWPRVSRKINDWLTNQN